MHRILVLNGNPDAEATVFDTYVADLVAGWRTDGHIVDALLLRNLRIRPCNGCWDCWWKTPGVCRLKDDQEGILRSWMRSDLVLLASPLSVGFLTSLTKHVIDRHIPLYHPYVTLRGGESGHLKRYDRYPALAGLLALDPGDDAEDLAIVTRYLERSAWHGHTRLAFCHTTGTPVTEVRHALDRV